MKRPIPLCEVIRGLKPYERLVIFDGKECSLKNNLVACVEKYRDKYKVIDGRIRLFRSHVWAAAASGDHLKEPQKVNWKVIDLRK